MRNVVMGRIVHFVEGDGTERPAIITHVWTDGCANLSIIPDGSYEPGETRVKLETSVLRGNEIGHWHFHDECQRNGNNAKEKKV
jgi:hypothetical protein